MENLLIFFTILVWIYRGIVDIRGLKEIDYLVEYEKLELTLNVEDLDAWKRFFDLNKGTSWSQCSDKRENPCDCLYNENRVICESGRIVNIRLEIEEFSRHGAKQLQEFQALKKLHLGPLSYNNNDNNNHNQLNTAPECIELPQCETKLECTFTTNFVCDQLEKIPVSSRSIKVPLLIKQKSFLGLFLTILVFMTIENSSVLVDDEKKVVVKQKKSENIPSQYLKVVHQKNNHHGTDEGINHMETSQQLQVVHQNNNHHGTDEGINHMEATKANYQKNNDNDEINESPTFNNTININNDIEMHKTTTEMHNDDTEIHKTTTEIHDDDTEMHKTTTEIHDDDDLNESFSVEISDNRVKVEFSLLDGEYIDELDKSQLIQVLSNHLEILKEDIEHQNSKFNIKDDELQMDLDAVSAYFAQRSEPLCMVEATLFRDSMNPETIYDTLDIPDNVQLSLKKKQLAKEEQNIYNDDELSSLFSSESTKITLNNHENDFDDDISSISSLSECDQDMKDFDEYDDFNNEHDEYDDFDEHNEQYHQQNEALVDELILM